MDVNEHERLSNITLRHKLIELILTYQLLLKQHQTLIEGISIFNNARHLEQRAGLLDIILKENYQRTISAKFGLTLVRWFQRRRYKCDLLLKYAYLHYRYKSAERKTITEKSGIYVKLLIVMQLQLKLQLILTHNKVIQWQQTIKDISIFSNDHHRT